MGQNPNPIGTTAASTGNVVTDLGQATVSAGSSCRASAKALRSTARTDHPAGGRAAFSDRPSADLAAARCWVAQLSSGAVQQVTQQLSTAIVPATTQVSGATQMIGDSTGLGGACEQPVGDRWRRRGRVPATPSPEPACRWSRIWARW
ncbi:collagen-like triple helix repeat-containing protein [Cupriavidus basilensis]